MQKHISYLGAGMAGSLLSFLIIMACGGDRPGQDDDDGPGDDDTGSEEVSVLECTEWVFTIWSYAHDASCIGASDWPSTEQDEFCSVPQGWEPFHADWGDSKLFLRRCVSTG